MGGVVPVMMVGWLSFVSWCSCCIVGCSLKSVPTYSLPRSKRAAHLGWPLALFFIFVLSFHAKRFLSRSFCSLFFPLLFLCFSSAWFSGVPHKYTNTLTQEPARVYTGTTAAFHDTRPSFFSAFPAVFSTPSPLYRPNASPSFVYSTLLYHHLALSKAHLRDFSRSSQKVFSFSMFILLYFFPSLSALLRFDG